MELNYGYDRLKRFEPIYAEQKKQLEKWGIQNHHPHIYNSILVEEVGEVSQAILKTEGEGKTKNWHDVIQELIHVQAVAQSMIESIRRNQLKSLKDATTICEAFL